ncbi:MAG: hypothetical protein H6739_07035 [Alphaproteobacteria bacterium]|nr:hypothetical protein [Alphaproteobacteria bacterium]
MILILLALGCKDADVPAITDTGAVDLWDGPPALIDVQLTCLANGRHAWEAFTRGATGGVRLTLNPVEQGETEQHWLAWAASDPGGWWDRYALSLSVTPGTGTAFPCPAVGDTVDWRVELLDPESGEVVECTGPDGGC